MTAVAIASRTLLLAATLVVTSCASGPSLARAVTVRNGEPTRVVLLQMSTGTAFVLQNASSADAATFYGKNHSSVFAKIVDDATLQGLLDVFAEKGMFATSQPSQPSGVLDVLSVEHDGKSWTWGRRLAGAQASEASFFEARNYFLEVYNSSTGYRGAKGDKVPQLGNDKSTVREGKLEHVERRKP